ncbi:MAG: proton-conducting transporter membrane subunit [Elusimicrobia bacterium]|nr:proton-conducting transporter membrane subunit [Elusimicrobiota bacterium]
MEPILGAMAALALGALASLLLRGSPRLARLYSCGLAGAGCALLAAACAAALGGAQAAGLTWSGWFPFAALELRLTPLGALFSALVGACGLAASVHGLSYAEEYDHRAGWLGFCYCCFLPAMALVPLAANAFTFLFFWEAMTLASFFIVVLEHENPRNRQAGWLYLVMSQGATVLILLLFLRLHGACGSWSFADFRAAGPGLPSRTRDLIFLLALVGFGTKAGLAPLHLWLPQAHPAAPGHVSACMSGVMVKTGLYGFLLVVFGFLGPGPWWWGALVLAVGAASALLGVLYAVLEPDIKRLLAYSTVENVGIIFMAAAMGLIFSSFGREAAAAAALGAALYHAVNHAAFKSLLFLAAGSVAKSSGTRDLERLGGLIKAMPRTALFFLAGCLALSALPPFNGFVSEWLTFQSLLSGFGLPGTPPRILCLLAAGALALTGGVAAATAVKAFGTGFLALPRSSGAAAAREAGRPELLALAVLAAACLALGLVPGKVLGVLSGPVAGLVGFGGVPAGAASVATSGLGGCSPAILLAAAAAAAAAAWALGRRLGGPGSARRAPTWACGMPGLTPRMEYSAAAFSKPFRRVFGFLYQPRREIRPSAPAGEYFPASIAYSAGIRQLILETLYHPPARVLMRFSHAARRLQAGSINLYLGYLLVALGVLLALFLSGRLG